MSVQNLSLRSLAMTALASLLFMTGCSLRMMALRSTSELLDKGISAFYEESDPAFAKEAIEGQLKLLEGLQKNDPDNKTILRLLAQGFGGYAFLFVEDQDPERARMFYKRGREYGRRILGTRLQQPQNLGAGDVPALFWTAYCWGGWANLSRNDPEALADLHKVEELFRRVEELSPGFFYNGADLFLGAYYGSRPKLFGGDLEKSKSHFERALQRTSGKFLTVQALYARHYAVPAQDRKAFQSLLSAVLSAPPGLLPEQELANAVAKQKAKKLMEKIDELF